jgi:aminoglycoside phosphotransferase
LTSALPAEVGAVIDPATCTWDDDGHNGSVRRGRARARLDERWLDVAVGPADAVDDELARLAWLGQRRAEVAGQAPARSAACPPWPAVPAVLAVSAVDAGAADGGADRWLVTEPPPGLAGDAPASLADPGAAITRFARALRALHRLPVVACPFDASTEALLARARARVAAGLVDREGFQPAHQRYTPAELLAHVETFAPLALARPAPVPAAVITHGRATLGHVSLEPAGPGATPSDRPPTARTTRPGDVGAPVAIRGGRNAAPAAAAAAAEDDAAGWRRLEVLGVGDPYRDLAVAATSLTRRFDAGALPPFFDAYGLPSPDPVRLELFVLLDEFT